MTETEKTHPETLFRDITAEDDDPEITEIESLCLNCEKQGVTRLFLTKIPFFREVIVSSFQCEDCGYSNAELQPAGKIQEKGVRYTLNVVSGKDLNRQVVQTASATISIPELDFEAPPNKGMLTTVEGVIDRVVEGLEQDQVLRKIQHPEVAEKIDEFIVKLKNLKTLQTPFTLVVEDPSGNSFVENSYAPEKDPQMTVVHYNRTKTQNEALGILDEEGASGGQGAEQKKTFQAKDEVLSFPTNCPNCNAPCPTHMKLVAIPHFKEVVIMATTCDACGHRDNEVKGGSGIEPKGTRLKLRITNVRDMTRDVIKSDTCSVAIPELDFETDMGTLGGKFTTVEGLLQNITDQLQESNPFFRGDSSRPDMVEQIAAFCDKLNQIKSGQMLNVHMILDDPAGNSYIENVHAPDPDPELEVTKYERTYEQNESLGLNDMKTENYEES